MEKKTTIRKKMPKLTVKYINRYHPNDTELGKFLRDNNVELKELVSNHSDLTNNKLGKKFRKNLTMLEAISNLNVDSWS